MHLDRAAVDGEPALDQVEERGLARAILAHQPRLAAGGQHEERAVDEDAPFDAVSEVVDRQHYVARGF